MLGIRFILIGGVGEVIGVSTYPWLAKRDRREAISELLAKRDSLARSEFLHKLSLARYPSPDEPLSERETISARAVDAALDATQEDYLADRTTFVASDLMTALRAASTFEPTQAEVLPRIRLRPERMQEPERWRIGYERDTTLAGYAAFASDDTLITPERPLAYREIYWVVNGCAFKASYQGLEKNAPAFNRLVGSITFPESTDVAAR